MKAACYIFFLLIAGSVLRGQQYYIRGEVKDESGNPLQNVSILLHATGYVYHTGSYGSFGILTNRNADTLSFWLDGFQKEKRLVTPDSYVNVRLKINPVSSSNIHPNKLASLTRGLTKEIQKEWFTGDETYASLIENRFVFCLCSPVSSCSNLHLPASIGCMLLCHENGRTGANRGNGERKTHGKLFCALVSVLSVSSYE